MDKKTSYTEFSSQLNEKNIVILELGRRYTRCGFAGEPAPRAIIKTCNPCENGQDDLYLHTITDLKQLHTELAKFVDRIYFKHLAVSPKEKKVVIVENVFCKSVIRQTLTKIFFDDFNVPSVMFVPDHLMALATLGLSTGLIVDIGAEEAISIAVVDGVTLLDGAQFASLGSRTLDALIRDELIKNQPNLADSITPEIVENIRTKACFVAPFERGLKMTSNKIEQSKQIQLEAIRSIETQNKEISMSSMNDCYFIGQRDEYSPADLKYSIDGHKKLDVPGNLREGVCETLFELFGHEHSLTTMLIESILMAPIDCRRALSENILVIGGLSNLPGLERRLADELMNITKYDRFRKKIPSLFKFHKSICPKNYVSWLGASLFCNSSSMDIKSTTREQWSRNDRKNLHEWSDLLR